MIKRVISKMAGPSPKDGKQRRGQLHCLPLLPTFPLLCLLSVWGSPPPHHYLWHIYMVDRLFPVSPRRKQSTHTSVSLITQQTAPPPPPQEMVDAWNYFLATRMGSAPVSASLGVPCYAPNAPSTSGSSLN